MVSGFFTSPCDHDRIFSGDASEMRMALKFRGFLGFSKRLNKSSIIGSISCRPVFGELDVEREALELLHHDVEGLGQPGLEDVLAFDDRLVHAGATRHIVRLDGEHLLQRVGRAVRLEGPDLHLPEPLAAELCLTAERLLRDQRVRTGRARVDLVVDQMVELHHVHDAHRHLVGEGLAGPSWSRVWPVAGSVARAISLKISSSEAPSNTGDPTWMPFDAFLASFTMSSSASASTKSESSFEA